MQPDTFRQPPLQTPHVPEEGIDTVCPQAGVCGPFGPQVLEEAHDVLDIFNLGVHALPHSSQHQDNSENTSVSEGGQCNPIHSHFIYIAHFIHNTGKGETHIPTPFLVDYPGGRKNSYPKSQ